MQVKNKKIIIKRLHEKFCYLAVSYLVTMRLMRWLKQFPALSKTDFDVIISRAPYSYRKEKETHELIFSWLSRLAVLLMGAYARPRHGN